MSKYNSIEEMVDDRAFEIKEKYHIYYKGKRISLNHDEYNTVSGAKKGIRNYWMYWLDEFSPMLTEKQVLDEIYKLIEIRKVTF